MYGILPKQLVETLRNEIDDPDQRGSKVVDDDSDYKVIDDYNIELSEKGLKNVYKVIDNNYIDEKELYIFQDFRKIYDNPKNEDSYPVISFNEPVANHDLEITYHTGRTWIYPGFPNDNATFPRISCRQIDSSGRNRYIGRDYDEDTKITPDYTVYEVMVWVNYENSYTIDGEYYSGGKLKDYISKQVRECLNRNKYNYKKKIFYDDEFNPKGKIKNVRMEAFRDLDLEMDEFVRKSIEFRFVFYTFK